MRRYPRNRFSRHDQDSTRYKEVLEQENHGNDGVSIVLWTRL